MKKMTVILIALLMMTALLSGCGMGSPLDMLDRINNGSATAGNAYFSGLPTAAPYASAGNALASGSNALASNGNALATAGNALATAGNAAATSGNAGGMRPSPTPALPK